MRRMRSTPLFRRHMTGARRLRSHVDTKRGIFTPSIRHRPLRPCRRRWMRNVSTPSSRPGYRSAPRCIPKRVIQRMVDDGWDGRKSRWRSKSSAIWTACALLLLPPRRGEIPDRRRLGTAMTPHGIYNKSSKLYVESGVRVEVDPLGDCHAEFIASCKLLHREGAIAICGVQRHPTVTSSCWAKKRISAPSERRASFRKRAVRDFYRHCERSKPLPTAGISPVHP